MFNVRSSIKATNLITMGHKLFRWVLIVILFERSAAQHGCGRLKANSYYDGNTAVGEIIFIPGDDLQVALQSQNGDYVSYSWWKNNDTHPILFKISNEKMVIITDTRFREVDNTLIIRGMNKTDAGVYHISCSIDGKDRQTDKVELPLPEPIIADTTNKKSLLNTATIALILALVVLFIGQFVAIAVFCLRRRMHSRQPHNQSVEGGRLIERYHVLPGISDHRVKNGIDISDRRGTSISIESHYDKIPHDIEKEVDFYSIPIIPERSTSFESQERKFSSEHDYIELTEIIDCRVKKTLHYIQGPVRSQENKTKLGLDSYPNEGRGHEPRKAYSEFAFEPRGGRSMHKMWFDKFQPKQHKPRQKEDFGDYLDMDSFDRGVCSKIAERSVDLDMKEDEDATVCQKIPRKMKTKHLKKKQNHEIKMNSNGYDIKPADENVIPMTNGESYRPCGYENQGLTDNKQEEQNAILYTYVKTPGVPTETNVKHNDGNNQAADEESEEDAYLEMDSVQENTNHSSQMSRNNRARLTSPKPYRGNIDISRFEPAKTNKRNDQIYENEVDSYMLVEQISTDLHNPELIDHTVENAHTFVNDNFDHENANYQPSGSKTKHQAYPMDDDNLHYSPVVMRKKKESLKREPAFEDDAEDLYMNMDGIDGEWI